MSSHHMRVVHVIVLVLVSVHIILMIIISIIIILSSASSRAILAEAVLGPEKEVQRPFRFASG